ncbi:hypothetical protein GBAR_LOCUS10167 [Geodia barretti]|uniref:SRCR domain-containing protein n=1 Tax=Geodia barretti TaxID=519541 RepID=A0AA35RRX9_GEOBA|nr:hypothetical protein GBAR_LOCUS10167 [Geodia barretti]
MLCSHSDIILSESTRESFSIVEYCKDFMGWVILCDEGNEWTLEDATVVCRQAGRLGDKVKPHELGNKILNARGTVPQCYGNESHIDDCNNITTTECSPVLVDCGTMASSGDNRHSGNNVILYIVAVTVSLLLVALAVVCAVIIRVWKKGPLFRNRSTAARDASCQHSSYDRQCVDLKETEVPNTNYVTVDHHSDP